MSNKPCFYCGSKEHVTADCHDKGQSTKSATPLSLGSIGSSQDVADFVRHIDEMLESGEFDWAEDTLTGISETVSKFGRVTEGQRRAVSNIGEKRGW